MLEKLWDEILDKDQEWRKLIIISNLKEVQTYRAIWALILTGQLMWLDKPREDTDAIKIEKLKERTKDIEKYNYFERLHVHWSADTEKIEKSWKKTKAEYEKQIKSSTGLEQHFFETMFDLTKTAYDTIKTEKGRKQYRMEIFDEFFLEFNSDIFRQKGEGYLFTKEEYDKAIEELESAIEVWDKEGEYYASLGLALFYKNVFKDAAEAQRAKKMVKKGVSMRPRSEATQICMGMMFKAEGKDRMAMEAFVRALKINPQSGFARAEYEMLKTGKTNKDRDEAIGAFIDRRSDKDKEFDEKFDDLGRRKKRR